MKSMFEEKRKKDYFYYTAISMIILLPLIIGLSIITYQIGIPIFVMIPIVIIFVIIYEKIFLSPIMHPLDESILQKLF